MSEQNYVFLDENDIVLNAAVFLPNPDLSLVDEVCKANGGVKFIDGNVHGIGPIGAKWQNNAWLNLELNQAYELIDGQLRLPIVTQE